MAPEVMLGQDYNEKADIYSLAIVSLVAAPLLSHRALSHDLSRDGGGEPLNCSSATHSILPKLVVSVWAAVGWENRSAIWTSLTQYQYKYVVHLSISYYRLCGRCSQVGVPLKSLRRYR